LALIAYEFNFSTYRDIGFRVMVFNATINNISVISWRSVLLLEGTGVPGENHRLAASHLQTLSHTVVSSILLGIRTYIINIELLSKVLTFMHTN
jgi:hypothetical protein